MVNIDWFGPEEGGVTSTGARVSYSLPVAKAVRRHATKIGHKASWLLESRPAHRSGDSEIVVKHWPTAGRRASTGPNIDSIVYLTDPYPRRKGATQGIENGHWLRDADGNKIRWIEGHHILNDAVDSV